MTSVMIPIAVKTKAKKLGINMSEVARKAILAEVKKAEKERKAGEKAVKQTPGLNSVNHSSRKRGDSND